MNLHPQMVRRHTTTALSPHSGPRYQSVQRQHVPPQHPISNAVNGLNYSGWDPASTARPGLAQHLSINSLPPPNTTTTTGTFQ